MAVSFKRQDLKFVGPLGRRAGRRGRKAPGVLLLHGFPGAEKNADVARALLQRGLAVFTLHFRGAWGSDGEYAFRNLVEDALAGLDYLEGREGVDRRRLGVLGYSMGGWTALQLAAADKRVRAVAALAPVGKDGGRAVQESREFIKRSCAALRVSDPEALADDFFDSVRPKDPVDAARALGPRPLLLVHGDRDELIPLHISKDIYAAAAGPKRLVTIRGAAHHFLPQRERLVRLLADWFKETL
jgi:dipeptidyl aminopeptidase/acylaminoacyl peptidase